MQWWLKHLKTDGITSTEKNNYMILNAKKAFNKTSLPFIDFKI